MAKGSKTIFFCQNCGHESAKWMGQCPACHAWNSFAEEIIAAKPGQSASSAVKNAKQAPKPKSLEEISLDETNRVCTGIGELDRVLGGGIVAGSLTRSAAIPALENRRCCFRCADSWQDSPAAYCMYREKNLSGRLKCARSGSAPSERDSACSARQTWI